MHRNKSVLLFLLKFFGTYLVLVLIYNLYLDKTQNKVAPFKCSPITEVVANQSNFLLKTFGYDSYVEQHPEELSFKQILDDTYVARIVEGCNAMSVIILFIAFVVAFATKFKPTFVFIILGSLILYVTNIFRIAFTSILLKEIPEYQNIIHDFIFPGIIYGMTFLLWILWIRKFAGIKK